MNRYTFIKNEKAVRIELAFGVFSGDRYEMKNLRSDEIIFYNLPSYPVNITIDGYDVKRNEFTFIDGSELMFISPIKLEAAYANIKKSQTQVPKAKSIAIQGPASWPKNQRKEDDPLWDD